MSWIKHEVEQILSLSRSANEAALASIWSGATFGEADCPEGIELARLGKELLRSLRPRDIDEAYGLMLQRVSQIQEARSKRKVGLYQLSTPKYPIDAVLAQFEVDQTIHGLAFRISPELTPEANLVGALYYSSRKEAFSRSAKVVHQFSNQVIQGDAQEIDRATGQAALVLAQHTFQQPFVHAPFARALEVLSRQDPYFWLLRIKFHDFLANHRFVDSGQVLGTYCVEKAGKVRFDPELVDEILANRLRAQFGLPTVAEHLQECSLNFGSKPRWKS